MKAKMTEDISTNITTPITAPMMMYIVLSFPGFVRFGATLGVVVVGVACTVVVVTPADVGRSSMSGAEREAMAAVCSATVDWVGSKGSSAVDLIELIGPLVGGGAVCDVGLNSSEGGSREDEESV